MIRKIGGSTESEAGPPAANVRAETSFEMSLLCSQVLFSRVESIGSGNDTVITWHRANGNFFAPLPKHFVEEEAKLGQ